ncbi:Os05g0422701 [Oryza sativa Japonica Group]|uniref:Os05g0422701 protein n=1 Tax=Oryza sativa subsp. japonica TaxID=39947 RepID=A0A0P0WMN3_ORYSJ|nr:Os05g0422701 [Oryza sativa Japonica Group]
MDAQLLGRFPEWEGNGVADVPFEMYAYRVMERDKSNACRDRSSDSGSDDNSLCGDDSVSGGSSTTTTVTNASASASSRPILDRRGSTRSSAPRRKVAIAATKAGKCRSGIVTRLKPSKITASAPCP